MRSYSRSTVRRSAVAPLIFTIYLSAIGGLELGHLIAEVLGVGRDAGMAINHALIVHQKSASKSPIILAA
jgi:hypothetical protein